MSVRASALVAHAAMELASERSYTGRMSAADRRALTQCCLRDHATELGFADDEIESAVGNAIRVATRGEEDVSR